MKAKRNSLTKRHAGFRRVVSLALVVLLLVSSLTISYVSASPVLTITKSVDKTNPFTGESFVYTIRYANPSTTENAEDVVLEDILSPNLEYVSYVSSNDVQSVEVTNNGTNDIVRFIFKPIFEAGGTGLVKITARFPAGTTPETIGGIPNIAVNEATIEPSNGILVTSNPVTVTPRVNAESDWTVSKIRTIPAGVLPAVGQNVTYRIRVTADSVIGGLNLKDIVVTDTLPENAVFVSASNAGTHDAGVVTWNIDELAVGQSRDLFVVVNYPDTDFDTDSTVLNEVLATGTLIDDEPAPDRTASATHGFAAPTFGVGSGSGSFAKRDRQANDRYSVGQTARFFLTNIGNTGNVPFDRIEITDFIPEEIELTQISTGAYSSPVSVIIRYKTNLNSTWTDWAGSPFTPSANTALNVSALGLVAGEYVTEVRWIITDTESGQIQPGFANTAGLNVYGPVSAPLVGNEIVNTATMEAIVDDAVVADANASRTIYIIDEYPWLEPIKTVRDNQVRFNYGETVEFNLRIKNHDFATGDYVDPIAVDVIPPEFEDITFLGWDAGNSGVTTPPIIDATGTKVIGGVTYSLLTAEFTGILQPGQYVNVQYSAKIKNLTEAGLLTNNLYISTKDNDTEYQNDPSEVLTDVDDLDSDGVTTDRFVRDDASVFVNFMGSLSAVKQIQGANDDDFSFIRFPDYTYTYPGGFVNYRLVVRNTGSNGPITNIVIIDKLPMIGDTGVVDSSPRNSAWTPYLVNLITGENGTPLPAGVTVYYSTVANPSCIELNDPQNHPTNPACGWSVTPPEDITSVRSLKIDFGSIVMNTGDEIVLEWPMRAPVGAPLGEVAWNSFGYAATYPDVSADGTTVVQSAFLPSEPIKVGFEIILPPPFDIGNYVWEDMNADGIQDTGEAGINGVLVNLYQKVGSSYILYDYTRTGFDQFDNPGYYTFPDVPLGTYRMEFVYPKTKTDLDGYTSEYRLSPFWEGADREVDSNGDPATITDYTDLGIVKNSVLTPDFDIVDADDMSIDLGLYRLCSIGDRVWYDFNADGLQGSPATEPGIAGVTVYLLDSAGDPAVYGDGSPVSSVTTDANGNYLFTGLEPGTYKVRFEFPAGYKVSPQNVGANDAVDSDPAEETAVTAITADYTLVSGQRDLTVDTGLYLARIGNQVFLDNNADGVFNGSDTGIVGVTVNLYKDGNPTVFMTTTTDANGFYNFNHLFPGTYVVEVIKPALYDKFSPSSGTTPGVDNDSDVNQITGRTEDIVILAGDRLNTIDGGMYRLGSIGDRVWNDRNANGTQNGGEPGIPGIVVRLTDAFGDPVIDGFGNVVADTVTNASGVYSFGSLEPGLYLVTFFNPGQAYNFSPQIGPTTNTSNSDGVWVNANDPSATTGIIVITSNQNVTYVDQGMYLGALGDRVWEDLNANGIQDAGEPGIAGVAVRLLDAATLTQALDVNGNPVAPRTTNSTGFYRFDDLAAGDYVVEFTMPAGFDATSPRFVGSNTAIDSNADIVTLRSETVTLATGERNLTIDAGFYGFASLGDRIWEDMNANGIQNPGEPGIAGVTVRLLDSGGTVIATTITDATGNYVFDDLIPGVYAIETDMPTGFDRVTVRYAGSNTALDSNLDTVTLRSENVTLISRQNNITVDGGFYKLASIGDYVWHDLDGDGIQDVGESPVAGVTVNLLNAGGTEVATTTTDATGFYTFADLIPGPYIIEIEQPAAYDGVTLKGQGGDSALDSDINPGTWRSDSTTLVSGENNMTVDAGLYQFATIGDFVWNDLNANGIQDPGEVGVPDVTVNLFNAGGTVVASTTTGATGYYLFDTVAPGTYFVEVVRPGGWGSSPQYAGGDTAADSNINPVTSRSDAVTVLSDEVNLTIDAGIYEYASIGDRVWNDLNANGVQNAGESGIAGATVQLLNALGTVIATTTTDSNGNYVFNNLVPGTYSVRVPMPAGYDVLVPKYAGSDTAVDSNLNPDFTSDPVTLISGENNMTVDAGFFRYARIGDYIWEDRNANGVQNSGEPGIVGATVRLLDSVGNIIATTTTGVNGFYQFTGLIPGTYAIEVPMPAGFDSATQRLAGSNRGTDSNLFPATLRSENVTLVSGEYNATVDGGFYRFASIGDFVWHDSNGNGVQNVGEPGIEGVTVRLRNGSGTTVLQTTTTDATGFYSFTSLVPGAYMIEVVRPGDYDAFTLRQQGGNSALDSDVFPATGRTSSVTLVSGQNNMTIDAGMFRFATIGDYVWEDLNANGIQDAGEVGVAGVTVNLLNAGGTVIASTTTSATGYYLFDTVAPGTYFVQVVRPGGWVSSPQYAGSDTAADSNINTTTSRSDAVTVLSDEVNLTIDAGIYRYASIGDRVWDDLNANGTQDPGETGIAGATVELLDEFGAVIDTTTTDTNGDYLFDNLIPGTYSVRVPMPAGYDVLVPKYVGSDTAVDSNSNPDFTSDPVTLISNENNMTIDTGFYGYASLGDRIWEDMNANGTQNPGEPGIAGVTVRLLDSGGTVIATTITDATGNYVFDDLIPGVYAIETDMPTGFDRVTVRYAGSNTEMDSNLDTVTLRSENVTLVSRQNNMTVDGGFYKLASIGDYVWHDIDGDGIQEVGEPGIEGVTVRLLNGAGTAVLQTTATDATGFYSFTDLVPGAYMIEVVRPVDYDGFTLRQQGGNSAFDSDVFPAIGRTVSVTLVSGENNMTIDAGLYQYATIGDYVWNDLNADGIQDAGEIGVAGVTVNLLNAGGTVVASTTTDATGYYLFDTVAPGTYFVEVVRPGGWVSSPQYAGSDTAADSNIIPATSRSDAVAVLSNEVNLTIDAGIYRYASIGDRVWDDLNANGIQDPGEPGIAGATVQLLDEFGAVLATTTTDGNGNYVFANLDPGTYSVHVPMPAGYDVLAPKYAGSDTAVDSNQNPDFTSDPVTVVSGEHNMTIDAGFYALASLSDFVWNDYNENGIQDLGEVGMAGVEIALYDEFDNLVASTTTDGDGRYLFSGLIPGYYYITAALPAGYIFTPQYAGSDTGLDSNVDPATGRSDLVLLNSGDNNITFDVGLRQIRPSVNLQKYVSFDNGATWYDADKSPGPRYYPDSMPDPVFKFVVTNNGNVPLTNIQVNDDVFGHIGTVALLQPGEAWESSLTTQNYNLGDLNTTGPADWIDNQNVSVVQNGSPRTWQFDSLRFGSHSEGSWLVGSNYWNTGHWYYLGIIQPGESVKLPVAVTLDEELTTNEYMGATFYLQPKFEAIQITNEAVFDAWGMAYIEGVNKWLETAYDHTDQRWEATDAEEVPPQSFFWNILTKLWEAI